MKSGSLSSYRAALSGTGADLGGEREDDDMSIDARVETVFINENGSGRLALIDRPANVDGVPGIKGQSSLSFETAPEEVTALNGRDIWGGSDSIMLGDREIAKRQGYTRIVFVDDETFKAAVAAYTAKHP